MVCFVEELFILLEHDGHSPDAQICKSSNANPCGKYFIIYFDTSWEMSNILPHFLQNMCKCGIVLKSKREGEKGFSIFKILPSRARAFKFL